MLRRSAALWLLMAAAGAIGAAPVVPQVVQALPHDTDAFTQGLIYHDGVFYESTGLYGESDLREVDPATGQVLQLHPLPANQFGEGLALVDGELVQLTWQANVAHRYDVGDFSSTGSNSYHGQGWGLCYDGQRLVMSDGSGTLFFRDPISFALLGQVDVTIDGRPTEFLNELECVGEMVYANVWYEDDILRIDPDTGVVVTVIDASGLLTPQEAANANVLNGIAFDPATAHFFLTGKDWPWVFEVDFDFNPYGDGVCDVPNLQPVPNLRLSLDGNDGIVFNWGADASASESPVNSVTATWQLTGPGAHRSDVPGAFGVAQCDAHGGATSCADTDALIDPEPLLFYQVFAACGPLGVDEGPN